MIYPKKNEKYPMMSHDVSLYPIKSQNCHGCYPEIAALGWVVPSRTILGMNFRFSGDNGEIRKKHGNIFDGILSMVYINGMLMVYIYISFGMWFGNINERLIWKKNTIWDMIWEQWNIWGIFMGFNAEFYGPGRPWLEILPGLAGIVHRQVWWQKVTLSQDSTPH